MADLHIQYLIFGLAILVCFIGIHSKNEKRLILDNEPNLDIGGEIGQLKAMVQGHGSVYVKWGRNVCPPSASPVFKGYTVGKHYSKKGSGTNNLCLPDQPTWSNYTDGNTGSKAYIYGTEFETDDNEHIFNYPLSQQDIPCAVCMANKSRFLMIPARNNCYDDWSMEYNGYLMASYHDHAAAYEYICIDENPEFLVHGATSDDDHLLYLVECQCGSLPCPPYVNGRELACVVCSK